MTKSRNKNRSPGKNKSRRDSRKTAPTRMLVRWQPAWHALDQSLCVDVRRQYWLCPATSDVGPERNTITHEFCRGLRTPQSAVCLWGTIVAIEHPQLGTLTAVETKGLDYRFVLADRRELLVNAEETPGQCSTPGIAVDDWSLLATLLGASPPRA